MILLALPCGGCLGCRAANARAWTLRCQLELGQHASAAFTTLTYDDDNLPPTLRRRDLSLFFKRLRFKHSTRRIRFFGCGEYGEANGRPHYHAIIYGADSRDRDSIATTWGQGRTHTVDVTSAAIAYVAGYTAKKIGWAREASAEQVDPRTGELFTWQPPFLQMSRRPGIGGHARQFTNSWRLFAVHDGKKIPVPRFLHEAWKKTACPEQLEALALEKASFAQIVTAEQLHAKELIAITQQSLKGAKRHL